jgi:hypothetical protein
MNWKEYEEITKYIYESLGKEAGVNIVCYGNKCKVKGKSSVEHQIDVLTKHSDGIHDYRTAIECKYWKQKINKDIVMKLFDIIEDTGINKGVIVSKKGFTEDGITFAKYKNIGLVELREAEEKDQIKKSGLQFLKSEIRSPEIIDIYFHNVIKQKQSGEEINTIDLVIKQSNGDEITFVSFLKKFETELQKEEVNKKIKKSYPFLGAKLINKKTKKITPIHGITLSGFLNSRDAGLKFFPEDQVWLIMKSHFENRTFTISQKGAIKEND